MHICVNSNTIYFVQALFTWACPITEEKTASSIVYV